MRRNQNTMNVLAMVLTLVPALSAQATFNPSSVLAESLTEHAVPGKKAEVCVVPKRYESGKYDKKDLEHETALCTLNSGTNAAVCPKTNSTNPGLDWFLIPEGMTAKEIVDNDCFVANPKDKKDNALKKVAKYKLSTSCSYSPSIIGYYHLSRILGDIANVPVVVFRTFDRENHRDLAELALKETKRSGADQPLIYQTWTGLKSALDAGKSSKRADLLFTKDYDQSYGAFQKNPTDEEFYSEFFNKAGKGETRADAFRKRNPIYKALTTKGDLTKIVGREFKQENVQLLVQMKDAADMIVMDTIMSQQDRFGNIHYIEKYYYLDRSADEESGRTEVKSKKKLDAEEVEALGAVRVKEMILKDNDCGVTKTNLAKEAGLLDQVAHIDPSTYKRVQRLNKEASSEATKAFFMKGIQFTNKDYELFAANLKSVAAKLYKSCKQGSLRLSLNLDDHFSGQPETRSCDDF